MVNMEKSLVDRCIKRASDCSGAPYTQHRLAERCSLDISYLGQEARTSVQMKGARGHGLKKHRRIIPLGPPGEIRYASSGLLHIDFPSVELLAALRGDSAAFHALAGFYTAASECPYQQQMPMELAIQFAHEHISVEIDPDVVDALIQNNPPGPFGNSRQLICHLLEVEHIARKRRWKRVDLARWRSAGLAWPLVRLPRARPSSAKPEGIVCRVSAMCQIYGHPPPRPMRGQKRKRANLRCNCSHRSQLGAPLSRAPYRAGGGYCGYELLSVPSALWRERRPGALPTPSPRTGSCGAGIWPG